MHNQLCEENIFLLKIYLVNIGELIIILKKVILIFIVNVLLLCNNILADM